jgi:DNA invertase Pin-like site-specific DNA recombinase
MKKPQTTAVYMRISTDGKRQKHNSQKSVILDYLKTHGIKDNQVRWYADKVSGSTLNRPKLQSMMKAVMKGEVTTVIITRLDRLSRSVRDGLQTLHDLASRGIRVVAIQQQIEFNGAMGQFLATLFLAIAEFERDLIRSRIREGLQARREQGHKLGRKRNEKRLAEIKKLSTTMGVTALAKQLKCSRANVYSLLSRAG